MGCLDNDQFDDTAYKWTNTAHWKDLKNGVQGPVNEGI